jgi:3-oxoacyl-[acyl-carrier-protein] synthase II
MNPFCIPFAITNMGSALTAMDLGFMGPNYSISSACASGNFCILNSVDHIRNGEADLMLAGASDAAILPSGMGGFCSVKAMSKRNDDPTRASRPWDKARDGFVMGEGAGVLVLESLENALKRGAPVLCEVLGGNYSCDAHHMTEPHPDGKGVALAIDRALDACGLDAKDVDYVNAHATSTPAGDMAELRVLQEKFGKNPG